MQSGDRVRWQDNLTNSLHTPDPRMNGNSKLTMMKNHEVKILLGNSFIENGNRLNGVKNKTLISLWSNHWRQQISWCFAHSTASIRCRGHFVEGRVNSSSSLNSQSIWPFLCWWSLFLEIYAKQGMSTRLFMFLWHKRTLFRSVHQFRTPRATDIYRRIELISARRSEPFGVVDESKEQMPGLAEAFLPARIYSTTNQAHHNSSHCCSCTTCWSGTIRHFSQEHLMCEVHSLLRHLHLCMNHHYMSDQAWGIDMWVWHATRWWHYHNLLFSSPPNCFEYWILYIWYLQLVDRALSETSSIVRMFTACLPLL